MGVDRRERRYVEVLTRTSAEGVVTPLEVRWEDGRRFAITSVGECMRAHSLRAGGTGIRYTVRIGKRETHLFFDDYRGAWFVEAKVATLA